ncbi:MAG TPA: glycosyltransferase [Streptosporangiaceae bacterium]|nr:glycosyltransferase [Streptosporangiaceae bacterium]
MASAQAGRPGQAGPRPLRVAVVITRLEGGAGLHALRGALCLNPDDYAVTLITGSGERLLGEAADAGLDTVVEPSLRTPLSPLDDVRSLHRLGGVFREVGFDVVHTHTAKAGAVGRLAARRAGVPRIVHTYHGFPFHDFQAAARRQMYVQIERYLGQFTDLAMCVGSGVAVEAVRRELIPPHRVTTIGVVADGADPLVAGKSAPTPADRGRARAALGLPPGGTVVGMVGRLTYQKAPQDFLAALEALGRPEVTGVWVGDGELAGEVRRLADKKAGVRLVLAGERADVSSLLPAFDVFALPSRYEGLPTVVVEAMACGVPVVATAVNAVADVVIPGETGLLVPPARPERMAEAIGFLLDSPADAARMAAAARSRLGDRFGEPALRRALIAGYAGQH